MGRAQERIFQAIKDIRARTPFAWRSIDSDNDNARIEQKNFTHVRRPLGYLRYDTPEEPALIQDLYRNELRVYKDFFQPVMRLRQKDRVDGKPRRRHERAQTPYRILRASGQITPDKLKELDALYRGLNPANLKRRIDRKPKKLYALYEKKKKGSLRVNPYQDTDPSSVTSLVMQ